MASETNDNSARCQEDNDENQDNYQQPEDDSQTIVRSMFRQIFWVLAPIKPYYNSVKVSFPLAHGFLLVTENLISRLVEIFTNANIDARSKPKNEGDEVPRRKHSIAEDSRIYIDSIIAQLYKLWFEARGSLLKYVDCIANLYEDIVPLLPGDEPWSDLVKTNLSIRELCAYATVNMACRLCNHTKICLQHSFTFFDTLDPA